jgi:solute carrier family 25 phosphate transporter 23/24/25/41
MSTLIPRPRYPEGTSPRTGLSRYTSRIHLTGHAPIAQFHLAHRPYRGKIRKAPLPKDHEIIMFGRNEQSMIRGRRLASPRGLGQGATLRAAAKPGVSIAILHNPKFASLTASMMANPIASIAAKPAADSADDTPKLTVSRLMQRRPVAIAAHVLGTGFALFLAGGTAGALAKTCTAPLDRVKIIMQISSANQQTAAAKAAASGGLVPAFIAIGKSEGIKGYWKGNVPQVIRILPYSTAMLNSYEFYKQQFGGDEYRENGTLPVPARLASGALAACTATLVTYPLDIIRLRLSVDPNMTTMTQVCKAIVKEEGAKAFFKGLPATCLSISPYSALNFCAFDLIKKAIPGEETAQTVAAASFIATMLASGTCYPLDTIRRQMQLKSSNYSSIVDAGKAILARDGAKGLFRGFLPNVIKNAPNKSVQLTTFDVFRRKIKESEKALEEEKTVWAAECKKNSKKRR